MKGRDKCELLNEVRQKIAEKNNIEFTVYECTFEGDCTGTCPKCESEVRYLEEELAKKQARGEKINLEGISVDDRDLLEQLLVNTVLITGQENVKILRRRHQIA